MSVINEIESEDLYEDLVADHKATLISKPLSFLYGETGEKLLELRDFGTNFFVIFHRCNNVSVEPSTCGKTVIFTAKWFNFLQCFSQESYFLSETVTKSLRKLTSEI